jgi:hypothetical protein
MSGNEAGPSKQKKEITMLKKLLGATAMAAAMFVVAPAYAAHMHHAARVGVGCSGDAFAKAEGQVETMADVPAKFAAEREIAEAQDAMLNGKSGCAAHLNQALRDESAGQTSYPAMMAPAPFAVTTAPAPVEPMQPAPQVQGQGNWNWAPLKGAY